MLTRRIAVWWKRLWCEHYWRPALTSKGCARYCDYCDKTEVITEAEFYSYFGRMPYL